MTAAQLALWTSRGRPYTLARPCADLRRNIAAHGLTVWHYPDERHLLASPAEDHTPYSQTGWPMPSAYGVAHALDVMPRSSTAAARRELADLARRLIADRTAGVPAVAWIKYINWTDEAGMCRQERWMPEHTTRPSTDRGHIHISARSDHDAYAGAAGYDPLAPPPQGDDVALTADEHRMLLNLDRWLTAILNDLNDVTLINGGQTFPNQVTRRLKELVARPVFALDAEQMATLARDIAAAVVAADNPLGAADQPAVEQAVRNVLLRGVGVG